MNGNVNEQLLSAIRRRSQKATAFRYGILTADRYVKTLESALGARCYKLLSNRHDSYGDVVLKASRTLVYSNEDMDGLEEKEANAGNFARLLEGSQGVELPKNCLMVFRHTLTSSRKDRDGDTLHSDGAELDPKMLLLWQHVHTLPIGKYLYTASQNPNRLKVISCIVDMNELSHDAAVMVDNDMARFSHGFRALEFTKNKEGANGEEGGFDVKRFEVMEESMVSVPANSDTGVEEVILGLVEGGKLKSPLLKEVGKRLRAKQAVQVPGITYRERVDGKVRELACSSFDQLKAAADAGLIGEKTGGNHEDVNGTGSEATGGSGPEGDKASAPKETEGKPTGEEDDAEGDEMKCPNCGEMVKADADGNCPKCGKPMKKAEEEGEEEAEEEEKTATAATPDSTTVAKAAGKFESCVSKVMAQGHDEESAKKICATAMECFTEPEEKAADDPEPLTGDKAGRVLNQSNRDRIQKAKDHVDDVCEGAKDKLTRGHGAQLREASSHLDVVLKAAALPEPEEAMPEEMTSGSKPQCHTVREATAYIVANATPDERKRAMLALKAIDAQEEQARLVSGYRGLLGKH